MFVCTTQKALCWRTCIGFLQLSCCYHQSIYFHGRSCSDEAKWHIFQKELLWALYYCIFICIYLSLCCTSLSSNQAIIVLHFSLEVAFEISLLSKDLPSKSPESSLGPAEHKVSWPRMNCWYSRKSQENLWKPRRKCYLPKDNAIPNSTEEIICVWIHWNNMSTVRVILQGFVYPVDKGILLFLCK